MRELWFAIQVGAVTFRLSAPLLVRCKAARIAFVEAYKVLRAIESRYALDDGVFSDGIANKVMRVVDW
jgi:hypothetical protein